MCSSNVSYMNTADKASYGRQFCHASTNAAIILSADAILASVFCVLRSLMSLRIKNCYKKIRDIRMLRNVGFRLT